MIEKRACLRLRNENFAVKEFDEAKRPKMCFNAKYPHQSLFIFI